VMLRARGLVKTYRAPAGPRIPVLDGVDVDVKAGDLVVVAGASGSGKSTLLNLLGLLEDADAGEVWFADEHVSALGRSARSGARAPCSGSASKPSLLPPWRAASDSVGRAARCGARGGRGPRRRAGGRREGPGVPGRREHSPPQLSGGEQQRVAFCRAVLNDPP